MKITRRDFLNGVLIGSGAALLHLSSPIRLLAQSLPLDWEGYGGVGDYALSHGNTAEVIRAWKAIQEKKFEVPPDNVTDTKERYDLVIIGGGLSGLGAAYQFRKSAGKNRKCLILENHPVFGGQAKRNEFVVNGQRLIGPQASNAFVVIDRPGIAGYELFSDLGVPTEFEYQQLDRGLKKLQFDRTNYGFTLWHDISPNIGYFFEGPDAPGWILDLWGRGMQGAPFPRKLKDDFLTWRNSNKRYYNGDDFRQWLDTMTYGHYIEKVMGLDSQVSRFADPILASGLGLGCDAISAYGAFQISMPGFNGFTGRERLRRLEESTWHSFPGGNDGFSRYILKALIPNAIEGSSSMAPILNNKINFDSLDRPENPIRMRLGSAAVRIEHETLPEKSDFVSIIYIKDGKLYRIRARTVVMASGGWINQRIVKDLPGEYRNAYEQFLYSSVLVVNVALTNWRFLYELNMTGCRWFSGFGYTCNIRQPMIVGDYRPPLHPDRPVLLTFYVPLHYPGLPAKAQGEKGRAAILSTSYAEYEKMIIGQMSALFGAAGFNPGKDIAGIILNRWVYAYLNPLPGFYSGQDGNAAPRDIIMRPFGRIAFGHSELDGHQNWAGAVEGGIRAVRQIAGSL
jgi:spermidine dehydrogenase